MKTQHWVLAAVLTLLLTLGGGFLWGYRTGTATPEAQLTWKIEKDRLLGAARVEHRRVTDSLRHVTDSLEAESARHATDALVSATAEATAELRALVYQDSLKAARVRGDSAAMVRNLEGVVAERTKQRDDARRRADEWQGAYITQLAKAATLQRRVDADSTRLVALELQLGDIPNAGNPAGPNRVLRAAETLAIGTVTARACEASVLSVGCLAGATVTTLRLIKH